MATPQAWRGSCAWKGAGVTQAGCRSTDTDYHGGQAGQRNGQGDLAVRQFKGGVWEQGNPSR